MDDKAAEALEGVVCTLTGAEVARTDQSVHADRARRPTRSKITAWRRSVCGSRASQSRPSWRRRRRIAADAIELVRVEYEPLPAVVDAVKSLENRFCFTTRSEPTKVGVRIRMG